MKNHIYVILLLTYEWSILAGSSVRKHSVSVNFLKRDVYSYILLHFVNHDLKGVLKNIMIESCTYHSSSHTTSQTEKKNDNKPEGKAPLQSIISCKDRSYHRKMIIDRGKKSFKLEKDLDRSSQIV